jgi:hypothetical protein
MFVLIFSTTFVWNIFHSKQNWERYDQMSILVGALSIVRRVKYWSAR